MILWYLKYKKGQVASAIRNVCLDDLAVVGVGTSNMRFSIKIEFHRGASRSPPLRGTAIIIEITTGKGYLFIFLQITSFYTAYEKNKCQVFFPTMGKKY